ncbi:MAG: hypothetical protein R3E45_03065 [Rhodocyclaceae bacterium]
MEGKSRWKVEFFDSRDAWQCARANACVGFEDGDMARLWARTQDLEAFPLSALSCDDTVVAMFIVAPHDDSLMRQERAEIPVIDERRGEASN